MTCSELMTSNPSFCTPDDTAMRAAELMRSENIGSIPVVSSRSDRRVIGIVTDRDLAIRLIAEGRAPEASSVSDVMTDNPVTCRAKDDIRDAMQAMSRQQVRRVPIVDEEGRLTGIIAQADLARHLDERQSGEVLEDISQPGHNALGRAFNRARSVAGGGAGLQPEGPSWMLAAGVGVVLGAGLMATLDARRSESERISSRRMLSEPAEVPQRY